MAADKPQTLEQKVELMRRFRGKFDRNEDYVYGIFDQSETRAIGGSGLHTRLSGNALEIGYWIHKDFINQGYATEVAAALTQAAFEIEKVNRVEIHCDPANLASAAIPRKLGYTHEGTLRQKTPFLDRWSDSMVWGMLESERGRRG